MAKRKIKPNKSNDKILYGIIGGIIIIAILALAIFRLGVVGHFFNNILRYVFGELYIITIISLFFIALYALVLNRYFKLAVSFWVGLALFNLAFILIGALNYIKSGTGMIVIENYFSFDPMFLSSDAPSYGGGLFGALFYALTSTLFDQIGTMIIIGVLFLIAILLMVPFDTWAKLLAFERKPKVKKETAPPLIIKEAEKPSVFINLDEDKTDSKVKSSNKLKKVKAEPIEEEPIVIEASKIEGYDLPPISLFETNKDNRSNSINESSAKVKGQKIIDILANFDIEATLVNIHIGPSVTKFEIKPDSSVKVSRIQNISDNIKMELAAKSIRIESPIPGRSAVGIEIPNVEPIAVRMGDVLKALKNKERSPLSIVLGKDLMGNIITGDISKMPHMLIAGATGSGKSVCINTFISSLLANAYPNEVKLVLVDPKKVEFTPYHDIPHLLWPVITDATMASNMLKKIVVIMEGRFDIFADVGVRNIASYNQKVETFNKTNSDPQKAMQYMPYIVVIIDELADLMMVAGKDVEASIQRITQLARASGIHLIVATQRPSTDVITGIIKSNIPSRISFSVASSIDSRTILDQTGAEKLLGNGDMLYLPQGETTPLRVQGVYISDEEIKRVTDHVKKMAKPEYDDAYFEFLNLNSQGGSVASKQERDSLYEEAKEYVIDVQKASTSLLQRRFGIGYNRAAGIIDALEESGIIGPSNGSKPREVYIAKDSESE